MLICSILPLPLNLLAGNLPSKLLLLPMTLSFCVTTHIGPLVSPCADSSAEKMRIFQQETFGVQSLVVMGGILSKSKHNSAHPLSVCVHLCCCQVCIIACKQRRKILDGPLSPCTLQKSLNKYPRLDTYLVDC